MPKIAAVFVSSLACSLGIVAAARLFGTAYAAQATPPPRIYHVITTALCSRLHDRIRPAVGMILQNDQTIAKSPPLFAKYARGAFGAMDTQGNTSGDPAPPIDDSINNESPETSMALQQMSYLVSPIAQNLISAQTMLDSAELVKPTGNPQDDATLRQIKQGLLRTIAYQSATLDLINGFVQTQQMGELQHAGQTYLAQIGGTGSTATIAQQTANPLQDPNSPGLPPNPYQLDVTAIPGLAVGYNPLTRIMAGIQWLREETSKRENAAARNITAALSGCNR